MSRKKSNGRISVDRDSGPFMQLPWSVVDCPAYMSLSSHAKALLIEAHRQFVRDNNGRLLFSLRYLKTRGWNSSSLIHKAKKELIEGGFIFETVKGHRPNKASWYAMTFFGLDKIKGYDEGAYQCFERSAYKWKKPLLKKVVIPKTELDATHIALQGGAT
jgi:hypothetical protein